jgi:Ca-activated chloride channel family protein
MIRRMIGAMIRARAGLAARVAALMLGLLVATAVSSAMARESFVLIIDSSGSMAASLAGRTRLDAARDAILAEVRAWPDDRDLALVAYGHRRARDCRDIETVLPLGHAGPDAVAASLAQLRARGKTPLSAALRQAAALLPEQGGTIVLVSDGLETCHEDPCAVAEDLRKAHADLVIHVVGFGLPAKEMQALACIAGKSGIAVDAGDGAALSKALTDVSAAAAPPPPAAPVPEPAGTAEPAPPEPSPPVAAPPAIVPARLEAVVGDSAVPGPVRWRIVPKGSDAAVYEGESRALALDLPAGAYRVAVAGSNATGEAEVLISAAAAQPYRVAIDAGLLRLSMVAAPGRAIAETDLKGAPAYRIEPLDGQPPAEAAAALSSDVMLMPGRYRVTGSLGPFSASRTVTVRRGEAQSVEIDLQLGRVTLEAIADGASEPIAEGIGLDWALEPLDGDGGRQSAVATARPAFVASAGRYRAALTIDGATLDAPVAVTAGGDATARIVIPSAALTLEAGLAAGTPAFDDWRDTRWTVTPVSLSGGATAGPAIEDKSETHPALVLLPGLWRVSVVSGEARAEEEIRLRPGEHRALRLDVGAGRLIMAAAPVAGPAPSNIVFSAFPLSEDGVAAERPLATGGARDQLSAILPAGRYRITAADEMGRAASTDLMLAAGEVRRVDLQLEKGAAP